MTTIELPASDSSSEPEKTPVTLAETRAYLETLPDEEREFADRMLAMYEKIQKPPTVEDTLRELAEKGDEQAFENELQDIVYELMDEDPYYQDLFKQVTEARRTNSDYSVQSESIRQLDENYRKLVLSLSGLLEGSKAGEMELTKSSISDLLTEKIGDDKSNPSDVQKALKVMVLDETTNKYIYRFPTEIMPDSIINEWETYLASVGDYNRAASELQRTGSMDQRAALVEVDGRRKRIHDQLTTDFLYVIGLSKDEGWDFGMTRRLIATIRDHEFDVYGIEPRNEDEAIKVAHQSARMSEIVGNHRDGLAVMAKLTTKKHHH